MEVIKTLKIKATEEELKKMCEKTNKYLIENGEDTVTFDEWKDFFTHEMTLFDVEDSIDDFEDDEIIEVYRKYKVELEEEI